MKKGKILGIIAILVGGGGLLAIISTFIWHKFDLGKQFSHSHEDQQDQRDCMNAIKKHLKSPATAKFSNYEKLANGELWYDVDAENGFGAMIRGSYLCEKILPPLSTEYEMHVIDMSSDDKERYKKALTTCKEAKEFYEQGILSGESMQIICSHVR